MCGGVEYSKSGENLKIYFPNPKAALPLLTDTGNVSWVTWGNREETSHMPNGGWARLDSIYAHKWKSIIRVLSSFPCLAIWKKTTTRNRTGSS
jgi:hypothetical protein